MIAPLPSPSSDAHGHHPRVSGGTQTYPVRASQVSLGRGGDCGDETAGLGAHLTGRARFADIHFFGLFTGTWRRSDRTCPRTPSLRTSGRTALPPPLTHPVNHLLTPPTLNSPATPCGVVAWNSCSIRCGYGTCCPSR